MWHRSVTVALTHQLEQCKVLLPPEVLLVLRPHGGHHVVRVHDDVNYVVHKIRERAVSTCNGTPHKCLTVTKWEVNFAEFTEDFETVLQVALPYISGHLIQDHKTDVWRRLQWAVTLNVLKYS